jgi:hypothetical protein
MEVTREIEIVFNMQPQLGITLFEEDKCVDQLPREKRFMIVVDRVMGELQNIYNRTCLEKKSGEIYTLSRWLKY